MCLGFRACPSVASLCFTRLGRTCTPDNSEGARICRCKVLVERQTSRQPASNTVTKYITHSPIVVTGRVGTWVATFVMLDSSCRQHTSKNGVHTFEFEIQGASTHGKLTPSLPCTLEAAQFPRVRRQAFAAFNIRKGLKAARHRPSIQWRKPQPCFASLLQGVSKSREEHKTQGTDRRSDASAKFQTAAGWSKHLLCGALSAVVSRTTMAPLERIKLEIVLHKRQETMFEVALGVLERDGAVGFWKGNAINLLRTAPYKVSQALVCIHLCQHSSTVCCTSSLRRHVIRTCHNSHDITTCIGNRCMTCCPPGK